MAMDFYEVFPRIQLNSDLAALLTNAEVERVSTNRARSEVRVEILFDSLVQWEQIRSLERELMRQVFGEQQTPVRVAEKFRLSAEETMEQLSEAYWPSVLAEFRASSMVEYNLLCRAKREYPADGHSLLVTLEDSFLAHQKEEEIYRILDQIFHERCGREVVVSIRFAEVDGESRRAESEERLRSEAESILRNAAVGGAAEAGQNLEAGDSAKDAAHQTADAEAPWETGSGNSEKAKAQGGQKNPKAASSGKTASTKATRSRVKDPDMVYGRSFTETPIPIREIMGEMGAAAIRGQVFHLDEHPIRDEKTIVRIDLTDHTDSIAVKLFCKNEELPALRDAASPGAFLEVYAVPTIDTFDHELEMNPVRGIRTIAPFFEERMDQAPRKRVELHCHTKMSEMDGVSDVCDLIKRAKKWGHRAIAITDHGNVQAFPDVAKVVSREDDFQVLFGMEAYLVDDMRSPVTNPDGQTFADPYVVFDLETTGFSPEKNKIIEIGAVRVEQGEITDHFSSFVNPEIPIPFDISKLTGIRDEMVRDAPTIAEALPEFLRFSEGAVFAAHNADFDVSFIKKNCDALGLPCEKTVVDTLPLARILLPEMKRYRLDAIAKALHISLDNHHRAVDDAEATALIFLKFVKMLADRDVADLTALDRMNESTPEAVKKLGTNHAVLLAQNDIGRVNLYRLVSESHLTYFARRPRIPKSLLTRYREGILVGSACEAGELYRAVLNGRTEQEIRRVAEFYDYFEIMPVANNAFLLRDEKEPTESEEDLRALNRRIVELGEQMGKPVVATGDVHFLDPEDEVYRRIIMYGNKFQDADLQAPLYLRTTEEMLEEFSYLGAEKAEEVVITNPNRIVDLCEKIEAVRPDKCPPEIENSDQMLREICYERAHTMYGENLPPIVANRLERELSSIINNGFAMMYIIAQKLVWKSNEDGYLVGSRGSVGSSFAATMAGITEVNPLPPHYVCPKCHYTDFDSEEVRSFAGNAGCDMPDRLCPVCGEPLKKDGFDIPFETFLGFAGNKEPDIDLNFSGDYQSKAHKYTEVIFGEGQTYRAGTIGTMADKTAYGYVKKYYEEHGEQKRSCEIDRIVQGCVGVRRTTGQHPGGIIVLPLGEEICSFTPVQHPANDMTSDIVTTHFDYHSIDHNLLKLDILGHDDPTMVRMLQDLTKVDPKTIPLDSPEVMSLFQNTSALGITPEDIGGCPLGALGVPEFGTDYAMQILLETKPTKFSDLVRIAGLSHGTDVWGGNAQKLVKEGQATISTAICTRDDIMLYLIGKGLDSQEAFNIMERVRKGAIASGKCKEWPQWKQDMLDHGVPEWYTWSCEMIKYMFPKAHAAAYVMMAWRIAYYKVFFPLEYYAAFFSIRATAFDYELMCQGRETLERHLAGYLSRGNDLSKKEQDTVHDMRIVQEMYARGFEFMPLDIYRAHAKKFRIIDGKLMPSINTIGGMGDKAAEGVEEAAREGEFLSRDDFKERTKVSKPVADLMGQLGLLGNLPETNQLSLFDF